MDKQEILLQINVIFKEVFEDESITINESTTARDIDDWDSLTHVQLISAVEKHFNVRFELDEILKMKKVGDMVDLLSVIL